MIDSKDSLYLRTFYPEESLKIKNVIHGKEKILIQIKSVTNSCIYPRCGYVTEYSRAVTPQIRQAGVLPQLSVFAFHLYIRYGVLNTIGDKK